MTRARVTVVEKTVLPHGEGTISKLSNGRFKLRVDRKERWFRSFDAAREEAEKRRRAGRLRIDVDVTFGEYAEGVFESRLCSAGWSKGQLGYLRNHILPVFGEARVVDIFASHITRFLARKVEPKGKPLPVAHPGIKTQVSPQTAIHLRNIMATVFKQAMADKLVSSNAASLAEVPKLRRQKRPPMLHRDQMVRLVKLVPLRIQLIVSVMAFLGLRIGEALGLEVPDYERPRQTLHVQRQVKKAERGYEIGDLKTENADRVLGMGDAMSKIIERAIALNAAIKTRFLSPNSRGGFLTPDNVRNRYLYPALCEAFVLKEMDATELAALRRIVGDEIGLIADLVALREPTTARIVRELRWADYAADRRLLTFLDHDGLTWQVTLPEPLHDRLMAHQHRQREAGRANKHGYIFLAGRSQPIAHSKIVKILYRDALTQLARQPRMSAHHLRHSFATSLIEEFNAKDRLVSETLGHSRVSFTRDAYIHSFKRVEAARVDLLSA